jgi:hypothetical protein
MRRLSLLEIAFLMLLASLPLVSVGTSRDLPVLWWLGLLVLMVGLLLPPSCRFLLLAQDVRDEPDVGEEPS